MYSLVSVFSITPTLVPNYWMSNIQLVTGRNKNISVFLKNGGPRLGLAQVQNLFIKRKKRPLCVCIHTYIYIYIYIYIYTFNIKARASHNFTSMSPEKGWLIKRRING